MDNAIFYVYAYYFKSTGHIFYIGKGKNNRYKELKASRNDYFKNIINKYADDIEVKFLKQNLTEQDAWNLEKELIAQYKQKGECETNLHIGGNGGYTGNYDNPERSRKLSEAAKKRTGALNPHYGKHLTDEQKKKISYYSKKRWEDPEYRAKMSKANHKEPWNKGKTRATDPRIAESPNKGKKLSTETYNKMMDKDCPFLYQVYLNDQLIFENISSKKMETFCSEQLGISRTIIEQVIDKTWTPKFKRHQHLQTLRIERINRKCID